MPSLVTSVIGGIQSRNAAKDAAAALQTGAQAAGDLYGQATADNLPGMQTAYSNAADDVLAASIQAGNYGSEAGRNAAAGANSAAAQANALLDPFLAAGKDSLGRFSDILSRLDQFASTKPMSAADLEMDPGYQFRLAQGQKQIERSAAATGKLIGGSTMKALSDYGQQSASQEYQNAFNRNLATRNQELQSYQTQLGTLSDLTKLGYAAAGTSGTNLTRAAEYGGNAIMNGDMYAGDKLVGGTNGAATLRTRSADNTFGALMNAANFKAQMELQKAGAKASGDIGAANAWNNMLGGIGSAANGMLAGGFSSGSFNFGNMMRYGMGGGGRRG